MFARVPDNRLEVAVDVMADMLYRPTFADVDSEREVVLEEIAMVEDTPHDLVHDLASEAVFGAHPLGRRVIGQADVISGRVAPRPRRVPPAGLRRRADRARGGRERPSRPARRSPRRTAERIAGRPRLPARKPVRRVLAPQLTFQRKDTEQYHVCLGAPGIPRTDERRFAASILDAIVGGSASSRLFQEIREKRGMAYSVCSCASQYSDSGQVGLYVGTREDNLAACPRDRGLEFADVAAGNARSEGLARARRTSRAGLLLSLESTSNRMTRLGKATVTDTPLLGIDEIVRRLEAVSGDEVATLAGELFAPGGSPPRASSRTRTRSGMPVARVNPELLSRAA